MSRRLLLGSLALLLIIGLTGIWWARRARTYPPDDPRSTLQRYLQALERHDYHRAYALWASQARPDEAEFQRSLEETERARQHATVTIGEVRVDASTGKASITLYVTPLSEPPLIFPPTTYTLQAELRRCGERWCLEHVPPPWGPVPRSPSHLVPLPLGTPLPPPGATPP